MKNISTKIGVIIIAVVAIAVLAVVFLTDVNERITKVDIDPLSKEEEKEEEKEKLEVEHVREEGEEAQVLKVVNEEGETFFELTIEELNEWTKENWDIFDEPPEVGMREVEPGSFGFFGRSSAISPNNEKVVFSVDDYAAATTVSFILYADIERGELNMVDEPARGSVENFVWSADSELVAYTLGTARAGGDFLSVDDTKEGRKVFTLNGEEIFEALDLDEETMDPGQVMPYFRDLEWSDERLFFTTDHPEKEESVKWSIDKEGEELQKLD